jgi:cytochrome c553
MLFYELSKDHPSHRKIMTTSLPPGLRFCLFLLLFVLTIAGCTHSGNPENGKKWFSMYNCTSCHGLHANDGRAPHIAGFDEGFYIFLLQLRSPDTLHMPTFPASKLSHQDAADIYAYLQSLKPSH